MLRVGRDYLEAKPTYDHFAGAMLVPQLAQLGAQMDFIEKVEGNWRSRVSRLWMDPSGQVDSTVFELLVAAALVAKGRRVEFIAETRGAKTLDIRCWDPFSMQIECKRKRPLNTYEIGEEVRMRELFRCLGSKAGVSDVSGRFSLRLFQEAITIDLEEVAAAMFRQRLAAHPEQELQYSWGSVAFQALPFRVVLGAQTKLDSPYMLQTFGWNTDLPDWDGLICEVDANGETVTDRFTRPFAMVWTNQSPKALRHRAWSPFDLLGDAMKQFTLETTGWSISPTRKVLANLWRTDGWKT